MKLEDLPSLTELAKAEFTFDRYQDGKLMYYARIGVLERDESGNLTTRIKPLFWVPVPVDDAGGGAFTLNMKGIELLRWIRPQLAMMIGELKLQQEPE